MVAAIACITDAVACIWTIGSVTRGSSGGVTQRREGCGSRETLVDVSITKSAAVSSLTDAVAGIWTTDGITSGSSGRVTQGGKSGGCD